ncbi:MAG: AAA family ATPase [Candidatus Omnitrophica bacterium]|nr:AAA family ATPase [Candidatus Omnitrophota bacterium]MCM8790429.1 AAA family ATPase [Candidatus Omnitrophota bacterium]
MNGKGGTGKTTIAALITARLAAEGKTSILAIDADPNSCFADALGVHDAQTIVGICEDISRHMDTIPSGMTKDRFIEMRVQESLAEADAFDLLVMGRPEGPGCYCYVNSLLRDIIGRITKNYDFVIIDNAAGMEHISRRTTGQISRLVLVSDYSVAGVRSTKKIYDLAMDLKIKIGSAYLIVNRVSGPLSVLKSDIEKTGLEVAGEVPYSKELVRWSVSNKSIFEFKSKAVQHEIERIVDKLTEK